MKPVLNNVLAQVWPKKVNVSVTLQIQNAKTDLYLVYCVSVPIIHKR